MVRVGFFSLKDSFSFKYLTVSFPLNTYSQYLKNDQFTAIYEQFTLEEMILKIRRLEPEVKEERRELVVLAQRVPSVDCC